MDMFTNTYDLDKHGDRVGFKRDNAAGRTAVFTNHGDVLGYSDGKRREVRSNHFDLLRTGTSDASFLFKPRR